MFIESILDRFIACL